MNKATFQVEYEGLLCSCPMWASVSGQVGEVTVVFKMGSTMVGEDEIGGGWVGDRNLIWLKIALFSSKFVLE